MEEYKWFEEINLIKNDFLSDLFSLLEINSIKNTENVNNENPVGEGPKKALNFILDLAKRDGFSNKMIENIAGHISYGSGEEIVGVLGHVDVVPVGTKWNTNPFVPEIHDGKIYARGALDDKGPLMAAYYALKILKEKGIECNKIIRIIIGSDEESDWKCMDSYFKREKLPVCGFSPDGFFPIVNAEKGILNLNVKFSKNLNKSSKNKIINFSSGEKSNMVPGSAQVKLFLYNKEEFMKYLSEYTYKNKIEYKIEVCKHVIFLTFTGESVHSMNPQLGKNGGTFLLDFLFNTNLFSDYDNFLKFNHLYLHKDFEGDKFLINHSDQEMGNTTICPSIFQYKEGVGGSVFLDIRFPKGITESKILKKIKHVSNEMCGEIEVVSSKSIHYVSKDNTLIKTLLAVYEDQTKTKGSTISIGGATYARLIPNCVAYGALFPSRKNTMHQPNEYVWLEDLLLTISIYTEALYRLTR